MQLEECESVEEVASSEGDYFVFLANEQRRGLFEPALAEQSHEFEYVDDVPELLVLCSKRPPAAVVADLATVARLNKAQVAAMFDLGVIWPVMRCTISPEGLIRVHCNAPMRNATLHQALDEIFANTGAWQHPRHKRIHLRMELQQRVEIRVIDQEEWLRGNTLTLSGGGASLVTFDTWQVGQEIEIRFLDFVDPPPVVRGSVVWQSPWEECDQLPSIGVKFDNQTVPDVLLDALAKPEHINKFQQNLLDGRPSTPRH